VSCAITFKNSNCKGEKMYEYIFFDLDGTLTNPGEGITNSVAYSLEKFNIFVDDKTFLYKFIGPPLSESFEKYYGFSEEKSFLAVEYYREYFSKKGIFENEIYSGVEEVLSALKKDNKKIVLATSKPFAFAERILEYFSIDKYFSFVSGATLDGTRNKKADVISYALNTLEIKDKSSVIMVGDRMHDIEGAKKNGIKSIGVTYGYGSKEELEKAGADFIVDSVWDIISKIRG
jgi:phosphoglycolate phosphatase